MSVRVALPYSSLTIDKVWNRPSLEHHAGERESLNIKFIIYKVDCCCCCCCCVRGRVASYPLSVPKTPGDIWMQMNDTKPLPHALMAVQLRLAAHSITACERGLVVCLTIWGVCYKQYNAYRASTLADGGGVSHATDHFHSVHIAAIFLDFNNPCPSKKL